MGAGREVLRSFGELMHDRVEPVYAEDVLQAGMLANDYPGGAPGTWCTGR